MRLTLSKDQAETVYKAMRELSGIGAWVHVRGLSTSERDAVEVRESPSGAVTIGLGLSTANHELQVIEAYSHQSAFARAYGLG